MELRWTEEAATVLEQITDYLFQNAPERAVQLVRGIYDAASSLQMFPYRGRPGTKDGTRELVLAPLPYIVVYQTTSDVIHIVRILHGAQKWPL
ncbi:MAG: type II toxin-antitoxin system RelE/ParE family toxin [Terriglobia bacterium]